MPAYNNTPFPPLPEVAIPGVPSYFFGSFPRDTDDTYMRVSNVALTTNVASVTGTIFKSNIPVVGVHLDPGNHLYGRYFQRQTGGHHWSFGNRINRGLHHHLRADPCGCRFRRRFRHGDHSDC